MRAGPLAALRERNLRLVVGAECVSTLGSTMAQVALAFAVLAIGTPTDLGLVLLGREVPIVVLLLAGGVWADRVSRRRVIVGADLLRGSVQAVGATLLLTGSASIAALALLQAVFGMADAFSRPARTGLVLDAVQPARLQDANAFIYLARGSLKVVGPAVGAAIVVTLAPGWALVADALSFLASASLVARLTVTARRVARGASEERGGAGEERGGVGEERGGARKAPRRRGMLADLRMGWREFTTRRWAWMMVASFGLFQLTMFPPLLVLGPYVAKTRLGGAGAWGTILALQAAGAALGGIVALRVRPRRPLMTCSLLCLPMAALLAMLGAGAGTWLLATVACAAAACLSTTDVVWYTTLQRRIPAELISRISSFDWFGSVALNPLGYALIGPLSAAIGVGTALYAAAALSGCTSLAVSLSPQIRRLGAGAEPVAVTA